MDNPLPGPSVVPEFSDALRTAGRTIISHDAEWKRTSGVPPKGVCARFHTALSEILRVLLLIDQVDGLNVIGVELLVRFLIMIEGACDRNPKQPAWEGLGVIVNNTVSSRGALETSGFTSWLSTIQKDKATVLKQGRLLREERAAEEKKNKGDKGKHGEDQ